MFLVSIPSSCMHQTIETLIEPSTIAWLQREKCSICRYRPKCSLHLCFVSDHLFEFWRLRLLFWSSTGLFKKIAAKFGGFQRWAVRVRIYWSRITRICTNILRISSTSTTIKSYQIFVPDNDDCSGSLSRRSEHVKVYCLINENKLSFYEKLFSTWDCDLCYLNCFLLQCHCVYHGLLEDSLRTISFDFSIPSA